MWLQYILYVGEIVSKIYHSLAGASVQQRVREISYKYQLMMASVKQFVDKMSEIDNCYVKYFIEYPTIYAESSQLSQNLSRLRFAMKC